ncbi:NAD dehydrogenase [Penicillium atrosanguineum]|uniref:Zinc finger PHD-type domain-containing protein n=1 Tax=Penicillium atrosanguineum TaxID=1132637 RepID=A0A9W9U8S6_9EURO|nr:NAD dehydrogenase [Penicillium atrosanguineum]KAJ5305016.1 NAD dehydrogenase [Penicillium atrosanguineum]KAJ5324482.1 hypothetical protein N7476_003082 [Penicillium atrosanguineum]
MGSRKRSRSDAVAATEQQTPEEPGLLQRIRSSWEFASLMQYIAIFGKVMKIDEEFEIEDLEDECMKPEPSHRLLEIGLCLLKWISSHRGLTFETFDEYTKRQYNAKAPHITNPFGYDEEPLRFLDFDVFQKLRVLHQLSVWTFWNADRIREKMPEKKETEQLQWRIEDFGYDHEGRIYYVLDDNRLYRRTDPPIPAPSRPKKKPKSRSSRASRTSKRASNVVAEEPEDDEIMGEDGAVSSEPKWECVCVTLTEYQEFLDSIRKSKNADDKILRKQIEDHVLPLLEKAEEAQQRKRQKREKELLNMQLIAGAKRSSRLAAKDEKERADREAADAVRKKEADLAEARKEQAKQHQLEEDRQSRMMTREQRIKDREQKRILHEAELERLAAEQERIERGESRVSARNLKAELEKSQKNLAELSQDDEWIFDCSGCGVYGQNLDDGSHSVACEKCNVWQHSHCLGISKADAEKDDFHLICKDCKRKEEDANKPKLPPLKFRLSASASPSSAPPSGKKRKVEDDEIAPPSPVKQTHAALSSAQNGHHTYAQSSQPALPSFPAQGNFYVPPSPERRPHPAAHLPSSSPPRVPFSPSRGMGAPPPMHAMGQPELPRMNMQPMQSGAHLPPIGSFARPSSSHSGYGPAPPSMPPTQGNREVRPIAGFPQAPTANGSAAIPGTSSFDSYATPRPQSGYGGTPTMSNRYPSFSASATPNGNHSSPPHSSHGMGMSGISPTKQSPRPMTSGGMAGAPVLPPIRRLEPSPKLMGRNSPDAPIPPPVKCMTPEQEERRQRENATIFQQSHAYAGNGQLMSSPSMNRIPSLGPAATSQYPEPVPSPQHNNAPRQ